LGFRYSSDGQIGSIKTRLVQQFKARGLEKSAGKIRPGFILGDASHVQKLNAGIHRGGFHGHSEGFHHADRAFFVHPSELDIPAERGGDLFDVGVVEPGVADHIHHEIVVSILVDQLEAVFQSRGGALLQLRVTFHCLVQPGWIGAGGFEKFIARVGKHVDAYFDVSAGIDGRDSGLGQSLQFHVEGTGLERAQKSSRGFNLLDTAPGLFTEFSSQGFDVPASPGRIYHLGEVSFFRQNELLVSGNAAGKLIRDPYGIVKRGDFKAVHASDHSREAFRGSPEQIHPDIVAALVESSGHAMNPNPLGVFTPAPAFDELRPQHSGSSDFGDFHKEIGAQRQTEIEAGSKLLDGKPALGEFADDLMS